MSKKEKIVISLIGTFLVVLAIFSFFIDFREIEPEYQNTDIDKASEIKSFTSEIAQKKESATLQILEKEYWDEIKRDESVYDFMSRFKDKKKINFKDRTYTGLGKFIEEINGVKSNGEKYWIYYINGEKAKIGVSEYKLKSGDVVSWKYENELKGN